MIFGHIIDFVDEPSLNYPYRDTDPHRTIRVVSKRSLPVFEHFSDFAPHSKREVRYAFHAPMAVSRGKGVEWMMEIKHLLRLVWFPQERTIGYVAESSCSPQQLRFWVYHTFLPLLLQLEERYHILHVGSVKVADEATLFLAPSFGGKSTLTDYFLQKGHALLSDDTLAVETIGDTFRAVASWPFHRPYREPEVLGKETDNFVTHPLPVRTIFKLEKNLPDAPVTIETIKGIEKFKALHYATFIPISFLKEQSFAFHTAFAKSVSIYRIGVPWRKERLDEVYRAVIDTVRSSESML